MRLRLFLLAVIFFGCKCLLNAQEPQYPYNEVVFTIAVGLDGSGTHTSSQHYAISQQSCKDSVYTGRVEQGWEVEKRVRWRGNYCERFVSYKFIDLDMLNDQLTANWPSDFLPGDPSYEAIRVVSNGNRFTISFVDWSNGGKFYRGGRIGAFIQRTYVVILPVVSNYTGKLAQFDKVTNTVSWPLPSNEFAFDYRFEVSGVLARNRPNQEQTTGSFSSTVESKNSGVRYTDHNYAFEAHN